MPNIFAPFGLQDLEKREGASPTYGLSKVSISSTDANPIFSGDLVQPLGTNPASGAFGEYITQASNAAGLTAGWYTGVFRGCEFLSPFVGRVIWSPFWPGAGAAASSQADPIAYVQRDPDMQFIIQASTAATLGSSIIGQNYGVTLNASTGNQITGQSVIALATSAAGFTGSSGALRVKDFWSNLAPGLLPNQPITAAQAAAAGLGFVNGTDNTVPGPIIVVQLNNIGDLVTTGSSI